MGGKKGGENSKKAAGNAKKAEVAAKKQAAEDVQKAAEEEREWSKGAKSNAKKEQADAKRAEAQRKKAERETQLAAEEASQPSKPKNAGAKSAPKKSRGTLDLGELDEPSSKASTLNATGIENALDALTVSSNSKSKIDRHPERRYKAAYAAFEARRLPEIEEEHKGLRRQQRVDIVRKEFEKSEENPFNQVNVAFDASKEEIEDVRAQEKAKIEGRLASS